MPSDVTASGAEGVEETSPDMLKNTPSNIRRLVNEIEQYESRQKYLAHTRSPSDGGDVRWYFCKVPLAVNELAASVPRTEIVGKGDYFRFGMRDSLAIEASFLQREDELLSSWWKEYAECSEGPRGKAHTNSKSSLKSSDIPESLQLFTTEEERVGVPVKGGLYEVDLVKRHCFPVYWNGENRRVLRGHWFARKGGLDWLPLREDVSEQLEYAYRSQVWHRRTFQPSGLFAARVDLQGSTPGLHALFTGEDDTWEAWLSVDSGFSSVVSFGRNSSKLRRGYAPSQSQKPTKEFKEGLASHSHAFVDQMNTVRVKVLTICESRCNDGQDEESKNTQVKEERSYGSIMMERLTGSLDGRVDHVLQDKTFRHPYLSAIGSHTNYWRDYDTALFILKHLYRNIPDGPISHDEQPESSSKDENSYKQWSDPREIEDEELPLTFADSVSIKNFSHRAKKMMK
ncbi:UNVERIFIED_CONTAM: Phospholipase SGR2 [Sesamum indicum]